MKTFFDGDFSFGKKENQLEKIALLPLSNRVGKEIKKADCFAFKRDCPLLTDSGIVPLKTAIKAESHPFFFMLYPSFPIPQAST